MDNGDVPPDLQPTHPLSGLGEMHGAGRLAVQRAQGHFDAFAARRRLRDDDERCHGEGRAQAPAGGPEQGSVARSCPGRFGRTAFRRPDMHAMESEATNQIVEKISRIRQPLLVPRVST